jgi:uncharacterized protein YecE (DUF72 family)
MQEDLFGDAIPQPPASKPAAPSRRKITKVSLAASALELSELAAQLPETLRFGVSTWSYPGWQGLVWDGEYEPSTLSKHGLEAYHQHPLMRTVCIDRTFWRPLTVTQYGAYAAQVDKDFRFVVKCPSLITDAQVRDEQGKVRKSNPDFLNPRLAVEQFVQPAVEGLGASLGVLVFQLSPLSWAWLHRPADLFHKLGHMLAAAREALPQGSSVVLAVEVRDPELLSQNLVDTLKANGATFCLGLHGKMPPIEEQLPILRALWPGPFVCRWNLNREFGAYGYADAQKKHTPFNAIVSEDLPTRTVLARTIGGITGAGQAAYVTISNDAEGCAPLSIQRLAQLIAAQKK